MLHISRTFFSVVFSIGLFACFAEGQAVNQVLINDDWQPGSIIHEYDIKNFPKEAKRRACINLGVPTNAKAKTIRKIYLAQARQYHPDRGGNHHVMAVVNQAYEILSLRNKPKPPLRRSARIAAQAGHFLQ